MFHKMHWSVAQAIFYGGHATALELGSGEGVHGLLHWYRKQYLSYANQYYLWLAISQILANCQRRGLRDFCVTLLRINGHCRANSVERSAASR